MTEEEIIQIWNSSPPQGDPTGEGGEVRCEVCSGSSIQAYERRK